MHKHHLLPRHVIEWNDPINLVECTVEEHAEYHRYLWETFNFYEDYIAWQCLSGQISQEEAILKAISFARTGSKLSKETKEKISQSLTGRKRNPHTEETKRKISEARKGNEAWNKGIKTGPQPEITRLKKSIIKAGIEGRIMKDYSHYSFDQIKKMAFEKELDKLKDCHCEDKDTIVNYLESRIHEINDIYKDF